METGLVHSSTSPLGANARGRPNHELHEGPAGHGRPAGPAEYLLVIYPRGEILDRLLAEQEYFSSEYGLNHRLDQGQRMSRNRPHITLASFLAEEAAEDTLIRWIRRICLERKVFDLALNNYSGIPPHTIFLRVQDPAPLREMQEQFSAIDEYIRASGWPPVELNRRPYVSIAGGLTEQVYQQAMPDYSRKTFYGIVRVGELVLLRRKHAFDPCKTVNVFALKN